MSIIVKAGRVGKRVIKKLLPAPEPSISCSRRIERVCTQKRICAMTFDDGPMNLAAAPDRFDGRALTEVLLDTLARHGARATFDVIGDTSENYPDEAGKPGSAAWGGIRFDHYPDIHRDEFGGALHNETMIRRMIAEGHEISNHGYRHVLFGRKPFVYGKRIFLENFDAVISDLQRLHGLMEERYGYTLRLMRPPHYVDALAGGFSAYDACDVMGYQYMAASFDGAGWLPSVQTDPERALQAEIDAMTEPMRTLLEADPDALCGQIIFQKDGYNMARRTPVAFGLDKQLELLDRYGYRVVPVSELMEESCFADLGRDDPLYEKMAGLARTHAVVYSDNRVRLDRVMSRGELAMLLAPREESIVRRLEQLRRREKVASRCAGAMAWCAENGFAEAVGEEKAPLTALPGRGFAPVMGPLTRRAVYEAYLEE